MISTAFAANILQCISKHIQYHISHCTVSLQIHLFVTDTLQKGDLQNKIIVLLQKEITEERFQNNIIISGIHLVLHMHLLITSHF